MNRILLSLLVAAAVSTSIVRAQEPAGDGDASGQTTSTPEELQEAVNGLGDRATLLENAVDALKSIKVSGYIQAEWQHFDQNTSVGGRAVNGYSNANKNFFTIRRGRIKFQHKLGTSMSYVLQADVTETGARLKDAYMTYSFFPEDPDNELIAQVGAFNRPNYEVELSSSARESAERSLITRAFYPDERDLGLMFTYHPTLFENFDPKLQVGIFNGNGIVVPESDPYKDLITRLTFPLPLGGESPVQADLGASFYYGGIPQTGDSIVEWEGETRRVVANTESGSMAGWGNRTNFNVEGQIYLDVLPFGGTIIKGELMSGQRPTAGAAATSATVGIGLATSGPDSGKQVPKVIAGSAAKPLSIRNQSGFYAYLVQNIGSNFQLVGKYDVFDRNADLSGTNVKAFDDAKTSVLGLGVNVFIDNIRITAWYEMPTYAKDEVGATEDVKDNKTTLRFQYKF
jgi:hypothetical protein